MDAVTLRELQAPLKQLYRDDPLKSRIPLEAEASFETDGITVSVQTWAGPTRAGLHPATGGDGSDACSGDMLLQTLLGCAGVTMRSVATAMGVDISKLSCTRPERSTPAAPWAFPARYQSACRTSVSSPTCRPMQTMRRWPSWPS
jgi:hypothetical protein